MKKKWESPDNRQWELSRSEKAYEKALQEQGFEIKGVAVYNEFTDYLIEKDNIEMRTRHFRGTARKDIINKQIWLVVDTFNMRKKLEYK